MEPGKPEQDPQRAAEQTPGATPGDDAVALSKNYATRLWLDHYISHTVPATPRAAASSFASSEQAVEKMLLDEVELVRTESRKLHLPPPLSEENGETAWPGAVSAIPLWEAIQPEDPGTGIARVVEEQMLRRATQLGCLVAADLFGLTDLTNPGFRQLLLDADR